MEAASTDNSQGCCTVAVQCTMESVKCVNAVFSLQCEMITVWYSLCIVRCAVSNVLCAEYSVHSTVCSKQYVVWCVQCVVLSLRYAVYCMPCAVCSVQCSVWGAENRRMTSFQGYRGRL